jgi:hypothetical protein
MVRCGTRLDHRRRNGDSLTSARSVHLGPIGSTVSIGTQRYYLIEERADRVDAARARASIDPLRIARFTETYPVRRISAPQRRAG